ncbi:hypothetical protein L1987_78897 [Smallanthus sonchifolius]|uniref:Uncharacterized protein n=1 Tax=Smallanthus sonchifolius TaxID=185202 RepID=A0ACB8ZE48_9ASTR|nr:hypothetical protein L1987_78897 [Smallanthus sonchifolius]
MSAIQEIKDGTTLVSEGGMYELGFFSPGKSKNRYLGIWYKKISYGTVVWVANKETPIADRSGMLKLSRNGGLVILSGGNKVVWSSNSTVPVGSNSPVVQLLDTGNLVVWNENKSLIWQSFDNPGDTFLPGMKLGTDLVTGLQRCMTSWKSPDDPSIGEYSNIVDTSGYPQTLGWKGEVLLARLGPWNGLGFSGFPIEKENGIYTTEFVVNEKEIYHRYALTSSVVQRVVLTWDGKTLLLQWIGRLKDWIVYAVSQVDMCDRFSLCGPYGVCSINKHPPCTCMEGFEPRDREAWDASDWASGCIRKKPLDCRNTDGDGFWKLAGVKVPDTRRSWYNVSMKIRECEMVCKKNCSCTGYTSLDIRNGGSGCLLWLDELLDTREYDADQDIYIRMAASELEGHVDSIKKKRKLTMVLLTLILPVIFVVAYTSKNIKKRAQVKKQDETRSLMLGWPQRFNIIQGMARGILYLHQDSRLQIIHRDLKAGNILLDGDMNPKISDFGLARNFVGHDTNAKTKKVVGTHGYISPEYAVYGRFSIKSDVFSFGVLVLEIISGKKNREFCHEDHNDNLLGHAWRLYKDGRSIELMSGSLHASCVVSEVLRSIHVALLCVQNHAEDRPPMLSVVLMLASEGVLPQPKQPAFFTEESLNTVESDVTVDEYMITQLYAR